MVLSSPRRRGPSLINKLDSRLRGNDDLYSASLGNINNLALLFNGASIRYNATLPDYHFFA